MEAAVITLLGFEKVPQFFSASLMLVDRAVSYWYVIFLGVVAFRYISKK